LGEIAEYPSLCLNAVCGGRSHVCHQARFCPSEWPLCLGVCGYETAAGEINTGTPVLMNSLHY